MTEKGRTQVLPWPVATVSVNRYTHWYVNSKHLYEKMKRPRHHSDSCGFQVATLWPSYTWRKAFQVSTKEADSPEQRIAASTQAVNESTTLHSMFCTWSAVWLEALPCHLVVVARGQTPTWQRLKKAACHTCLFMCPHHKLDWRRGASWNATRTRKHTHTYAVCNVTFSVFFLPKLHPKSWCWAAHDKTHSSCWGCVVLHRSLPLCGCRGDASLECQKSSDHTYYVECYTYALGVFNLRNTFGVTMKPRPVAKHHFFLKGTGLLRCKVLVVPLANRGRCLMATVPKTTTQYFLIRSYGHCFIPS